ncbi:MAG TPA: hypothetical protein VOA64_19140 [Candidatus Dormibacteraeota bacterium]|nr:hypothetical protein [Candidatus Dormibacteraeota bacterium]
MSTKNNVLHSVVRIGVATAAIFLVVVLLAAVPVHRTLAVPDEHDQESSAAPTHDHGAMSNMAGMDMGDETTSEAHAVADMTPGHQEAHSEHMHMTAMRPQKAEDLARANEIVAQLRTGIEKYKDYHVALNDRYKIFMPNLPQAEYHFTNYRNGFLGAFNFDPARPTSLLYKKTSSGYQLAGAMFTMPKRATEDQLNARVPLSVATWHLHTNLCRPAKDQVRTADWSKFGLRGSIATQEACDAAGGRFNPVIFGWMVHVYPYEDSTEKIFAMHHHMD